MAAPTIPATNTQAVQTTGGGTTPFTMAWYNFFAGLLSYITTGPIGPVPLVGVTDGSNAAAGNVGEYVSSLIHPSPGVSITNNVTKTITQITLQAGDWDLWGELFVNNNVVTYAEAALSTATTFPALTAFPADGASAAAFNQIDISDGDSPTLNLGPMRVNITSPATFFLITSALFSTGTATAGGAIRARRRR